MADKIPEDHFCEYRSLVVRDNTVFAMFHIEPSIKHVLVAGTEDSVEYRNYDIHDETNFMYVHANDLFARAKELDEMGYDSEETYKAIHAYEGVLCLLKAGAISNNITLPSMPFDKGDPNDSAIPPAQNTKSSKDSLPFDG